MAEKYILLLIVTFHPPLKNYYFITSSFGEYRTTHLHLGIDFSTNGKIGIPVYACEDGEIYRIKVSSKGYGKALFLRSNKYIYVYAHLDKFRKDIENFVFKKQLKRKKVELDLFPSKKFKVKEGEIIGYVGETGAGGPHLHFEIRNLYNQALSLPHKILNYRDLNKPVIKGFLIQIDSFNSTIDSFFFDKIISPGETVEVWGNIKISMLAYDREKKTTGISGFEVYLNDKKIKHFFFNKISINNGDFKKNNRIYLTKTNSFARSFIKIGNFRFKENLNKILTIKAIVFDYKGKSDTGKIFIKIRKNKLKFKENYWDLKIKELFIKFFNFGILIGTENQTVASVLGFNKIMNGYAIWLNPKNYLKIYEKDIYILETNKKNKIKFENWEISIEKADIDGVEEVIPTYRSILITYNPTKISFKDLKENIKNMEKNLSKVELPAPRTIEIPVVYGGEYGPDIEFVAKHNGLTVEEVIDIHSKGKYLIYMIGFTPGFPFLGGLSEKLFTPRLETPRVKVPAGSVGIANNQTGIYPIDSPGGWRIIGRTPIKLYDPSKDPPVILSPGDFIRFVPIDEEEYKKMLKN